MKSIVGPLVAITGLCVVVLVGVTISSAPKPKTVPGDYQTASGRPCTREDWSRQFLHGREIGEEACGIKGLPSEAIHYRVAEEWKERCSILYVTRQSDMTPKDREDWDFCQQAMQH